MTRLTPRLLLMGTLLSPATLYALGLGEIHLNSALNQPLDAEIELIAPTQDELTSLKVSIASTETFARYGLDRPQFLSSLRFDVGRAKDGSSVVKVSSTRSITEPFVTLLVEASWARGRVLREYTVLLDPPVFMPGEKEQPAVVQAPRSGAASEGRITRESAPAAEAAPAPQPTAVPQPRAETPASEPSAAPAAQASLAGGSTYTVQHNDTLYRIAQEVRPGSRRVVNQTMIALFRANPDAFAGSIHRLKAGSVLRIPESADIDRTSSAEASQEVARQTEEWRAGTDAGHLQLVPPTEAAPEQTAQTAKPSSATVAPPERAPAASSTTPAAQPSASAPAQQAETQRPVTVPSAGLSQMQERVGQEQQAAETPAQAPAAEAPAEAKSPAAAEPARPKPVAKPAPVEQPEGGGILGTLMDYWWALAGLLIVALGGAYLVRRRQAQAESEDSFAAFNFEPTERHAPSISPARDIPDVAAAEQEEEPAFAPVHEERASAFEPAAMAPAPEDTLSSETAVQLDQQDALAEADFHMAYGLYDQAADLVKIAIEREPGRRDLQLKLLEIYFVWGNRDLFLETARGLYATRGEAAPGEWDKVVIMGRQIAPEEAMFQTDGAPHVDAVDVNLEGGENRVDIDLFGEPEAEQGKDLDIEFGSGERATLKTGGSDSLDFLLDEPTRGAEDEPTRELDPLARTQETPTIESPALARGDATATVRSPAAKSAFNAEHTAELSLDDLGLDVSAMEATDSFEETGTLEGFSAEPEIEATRALSDDEMTQLAPSMEPTIERPREAFDINSTGTIAIDHVDFGAAGDTVEQRKTVDIDSTAAFNRPEIDLDLDNLDGLSDDVAETVRHPQSDEDRFSNDVFSLSDSDSEGIDLDVGDALQADDNAPTNTQAMTAEMDLAEDELEPVTMSEVGTKLDLARAYMDMGDPDGARSILEEVLDEGNANQKQEAQRLLEAVK